AANHAGTTPMHLRRDALAGAAEWVSAVENTAKSTAGLAATVAGMQSEPRAGNVIPGLATASLDVRHASDEVRKNTAAALLSRGAEIAARRKLQFRAEPRLDQPATAMN